ncbi:MAG: cupredoxin family copper-binding protein [Thermomicrobiales bacterium]
MRRAFLLLAVVLLMALPAAALANGAVTSVPNNAASAYQMGGAAVTIVDYAFSPAWVSVPVGSTVSWVNAGAAPHTVTSDGGIFDSGTLGSGGGYSVTFSAPGYYTYHCAIHPNMTGAVQVN